MICAYCGLDGETTFDHVIPRSAGGSDHYSNAAEARGYVRARRTTES